MMNKQHIQVALDRLYNEVNDFDTLQEQLLDNCLRLEKVEKEEILYKQLDMPELLQESLEGVNREKNRLSIEKEALEKMIASFDMDNTMSLIHKYEELNF